MSDTEFENSSEDTNYSVPLFSEASVGPYPGTLSIRTSNLFTNAIGAQVEDDDDHVEDDSVDDDIETQSDGSNNRSSDDSTEELNDQDDESNEPEHVIRGENLFMLDPESSASSSSTDDLPLHTIANIMDVSNNTITIDQSCAHVEVVDLDSESEPSLRATAAANEDDEDVLILSENLNDTDVLHMPVLTRPTPVVTNPPTVPTVPLARRSIPFRHPYNGAIGPVIRGLARLAPSDSEEDVPRPEPYRPKRTSSTSRVTKKSKQNEDTPSASSTTIDAPDEEHRPCVQCPICLDDMKAISNSKRQLLSTVCGHVFCDSCLKTSLKVKKECPQCRRKLTVRQFHPIFL